MKNSRFEIDMCSGPLMPKLISFAVPLMLSNALQLMFNAVDLIVVGRFAGSDSLAAVGATNALINMFINLFIGVSLGANVCAARFYASGDLKKMSSTVHTSILFALISGVVMLGVGQVLSRPALELMGTPPEIIDKSVLYMRLYFAGMPFFMLYNYGAAVLRAVGDTKRPMLFLVITGSVNAGLNVFLVTVFKLDVAGVAIATVISQVISCVLVTIVLFRSPEGYRLRIRDLRMDLSVLKSIVRIGIPAGLQSVVINFSNVILQSSVNSFGQAAMAGYTSANSVFGFMYSAANSVTQACMSFTSQNLGARKYDRMRRVLLDCLVLETVFELILGAAAFFFGDKVLGIYSSSPEVINYGLEILTLTTLTYFICGYMDCIPGSLRGMGYSTVPMILSVIGTVGTRVIWIFCFFPMHRSMKFLFISYPLSWFITVMLQTVCYFVISRKLLKKRMEIQEA